MNIMIIIIRDGGGEIINYNARAYIIHVCVRSGAPVTGMEHASPTRVKRRGEGVVRADDNDDVLRSALTRPVCKL